MNNPTAVAFKSADHAKITGYEIDIVSGASVVQTIQAGKGTQDASGDVTLPFSVQPLNFGTYTVRVRAVATNGGTTVKSADSAASAAWDRVPAQPVTVTIR